MFYAQSTSKERKREAAPTASRTYLRKDYLAVVHLLRKDIKPDYQAVVRLLRKDIKPDYLAVVHLLRKDIKPDYQAVVHLLRKDIKPEYLAVVRLLRKDIKQECMAAVRLLFLRLLPTSYFHRPFTIQSNTTQYNTLRLYQSLKRQFSCLPLTNNNKYIKRNQILYSFTRLIRIKSLIKKKIK